MFKVIPLVASLMLASAGGVAVTNPAVQGSLNGSADVAVQTANSAEVQATANSEDTFISAGDAHQSTQIEDETQINGDVQASVETDANVSVGAFVDNFLQVGIR